MRIIENSNNRCEIASEGVIEIIEGEDNYVLFKADTR